MDITTLQEYMELVLGVKSIAEIKPKAWSEIKMYAKDGFKFDVQLMEMRQEMDNKQPTVAPCEKAQISAETPPVVDQDLTF